MPRAARAAAFETRTTARTSTAVGTAATAVRAASAAIQASATAIATTVASTATEGPLEARARIATDASGVPQKIFAWSRWAADTRGTSFPGQENHVLFDGRHGFRDGLTGGRRDQFLVGMLRLEVFVVGMFVLIMLMLTVSGIMFGVFLSHVRSEFCPVGSAAGFDFRDLVFREFRNLGNCCFLSFFR